MSSKKSLFPLLSILILASCVSSKKFKKSQADYVVLQGQYAASQSSLNDCNNDKAELNRQKTALDADIANLKNQIDFLKQNNTQALKQLQDLSVISSSQAESIK